MLGLLLGLQTAKEVKCDYQWLPSRQHVTLLPPNFEVTEALSTPPGRAAFGVLPDWHHHDAPCSSNKGMIACFSQLLSAKVQQTFVSKASIWAMRKNHRRFKPPTWGNTEDVNGFFALLSITPGTLKGFGEILSSDLWSDSTHDGIVQST